VSAGTAVTDRHTFLELAIPRHLLRLLPRATVAPLENMRLDEDLVLDGEAVIYTVNPDWRLQEILDVGPHT